PTWQRNPHWDGIDPLSEFVLPEFTLGWQILKWIPENLNSDEVDEHGQPIPFRPTREQSRFILWWYAVDEDGRFVYRDGVLQRLKGWGKDPLIAVICAVEFLGPARFAGWAVRDIPELGLMRGDPVGKEVPNAWIDVAAVSKEQTINTMSLFPALFNEKCKQRHQMNKQSIGKTIVFAHRGKRRIRAVTSNPRSLEGGRATFVVRNETHHWLESNNGHEMAAVIERNATKSKGGASRALSITNAYDPSEKSVAQIQREAWEAEEKGLSIKTGVLYDSLELPGEYGLVPPEVKANPNMEPEIAEKFVRAWLAVLVTAVRGDAWWLDIPRITNSMLSGENPPSRSRRFWLNQVQGTEDRWVDPAAVDAAVDAIAASQRKQVADTSAKAQLEAGWIVDPDDPIVVFGDGSKSDDSTGLVGCRLSDGYVFTLGIWAKPHGEAGKGWLAPRPDVSLRVDEIFGRFNVIAFWFDPSHTQDDDNSRYWDPFIDSWHRKYQDRLQYWSIKTGPSAHSIMWDMTSMERQKLFVAGAETFKSELEYKPDPDIIEFYPQFSHDGHPALVQHLKNAVRHPMSLPGGQVGVSIRKEHRESVKKIDLAACAIGARMLRRMVLNAPEKEEKQKGGWAYAA
ncbi:MAG TPA: hypothetical protein VFX41_07875, partial [Actinomycetales bacterium]|nr:hypothetical protein [Actinomycetales bacterium]